MPFTVQEDAAVHNRLHELIQIYKQLRLISSHRELAIGITHIQTAELYLAEALRRHGVEAQERQRLKLDEPPEGGPMDYPPLTEEG